MRAKIYDILNKIYGILMTVSFFAGAVPLIPFFIAMIIGGSIGEKISVFIGDYVYPYVIALASIAVLVGWIAMYVGKKEGLSVKSFGRDKEDSTEEENKEDN